MKLKYLIFILLLSLLNLNISYTETKVIKTATLLPSTTITPVIPKYNTYYELPKTEWAGYVIEQCKKYNVPVWLGFRTIFRESHNKVDAVNINYDPTTGKILSHDIGLGQLCDKYIESDYEWKFNEGRHINPFDPYDNIHVTIQILAWGYNCSGTREGSLEIYNGGYGTYFSNQISDKTINYMKDILYSKNLYRDY